MNIESWCTVEKMPKQDWRRAQRGHSDEILKSTVFSHDRTTVKRSCLPDVSQDSDYKERRHFPEKSKLNFQDGH